MNYTQEYFSSELALPRLVEWFNALPEEDRHVVSGEMFLIRVKVLETLDGTPTFAFGVDGTLADPTRKYIGETVYLWIGPSGQNLTATNNSFFEISKYTQSSGGVNVVPFEGTVKPSNVAEIVRRMGFSTATGDIMGYTYGITTTGTAVLNPGHEFSPTPAAIPTNKKFKTITTSAAKWAAGLTEDGEVIVWGHTDIIPMGIVETSGPVKQIAALYQTLVMVLENGTIELHGADDFLWLDVSGEAPTIDHLATATDVISRCTTWVGGGNLYVYQWAMISTNTNIAYCYGSKLIEVSPGVFEMTGVDSDDAYGKMGMHSFTNPIKTVAFSEYILAFLDVRGNLKLDDIRWGIPSISNLDQTNISQVDVTEDGKAVILTQTGEVWEYDGAPPGGVSNRMWDISGAPVKITAGASHWACLTTDLDTNSQMVYISTDGEMVIWSDVNDGRMAPIVDIFAGAECVVLALEDGTLYWIPVNSTQPPLDPYGQDPYGQDPYGQDPYGQDPYGQDPN